ncbi:MAG: dynamin family protein [Desulfocucumaceae bacterium]
MNSVLDYISRVTDLYEMEPDSKKPVFLVAGPVNSGKSTLVNKLAGKGICPDDASPSTFFPVFLNFSDVFSAQKVVRGRKIQLEDRELRETLKNKRKTSMPDRVEIHLPSEILRWCSLADTPGIGLNEETDEKTREYLSKADGIIFLFHQRGIDKEAHRFLTTLSAAGIKGWISFFINANLGLIDGSSLTETCQAIKTLFPGRSEIFAVNAKDTSNTDLMSLFLKVRAMDFFVRGIKEKLILTDRTIPSLLERTHLQAGEEMFLIKLWEVLEKAELINSGRRAIQDLPIIYSSLVNMLRDNSAGLTSESVAIPPANKVCRAGHSHKETLLLLLSEMRLNTGLVRLDWSGLLKKAAESLGERFRIIVAGPFSTGKTTFLNALLGETLLPAEDRATTSCPVIVSHGKKKMAEVKLYSEVEFYPARYSNGKYLLDHQEIMALTKILETPSLREQITGGEICREGRYQGASLSEIAAVLDEMCLLYNKNSAGSESRKKSRRIPLFSRSLSEKLLPGPVSTGINITLGRRNRLLFQLEDSIQRMEFYRATSPPDSSLAESVTISYPSDNMAFADFIDTPGLDSLQKKHYGRAEAVMSSGDLLLYFLHAKHILVESIPKQISGLQDTGPNIPVIYIINFADTISDLEREKVSIYIRQRLGQGTGGEIIPYPRAYAISALNALRHGDDGFERLLRRLRKITGDTGVGKMIGVIRDLELWLGKIAGGRTENRRIAPEKARQAALYYLEELKGLKRRILGNGVL